MRGCFFSFLHQITATSVPYRINLRDEAEIEIGNEEFFFSFSFFERGGIVVVMDFLFLFGFCEMLGVQILLKWTFKFKAEHINIKKLL